MRGIRLVGGYPGRVVHCHVLACCLLVALAGGLAATGSAGAPAGAPTAEQVSRGVQLCDQADKLLADGKPAEALKLYQEVLTFLPLSRRAKEGAARCAGTAPGDVPPAAGPQAGAWLSAPPRLLRRIPQGLPVNSVVFTPDGSGVAVADRGVALWSTATGARKRVLSERPPRPPAWVKGAIYAPEFTFLAVSPDGSRLASTRGAIGAPVAVWDLVKGKLLRDLQQSGWSGGLAFSPNGQTLALANSARRLILWDAATGAVRKDVDAAGMAAGGVAFSPDGRTLAVELDSQMVLMDSATLQQQRKLRSPTVGYSGFRFAAFSPDGGSLVIVDQQGQVFLWRLAADAPPTLLAGARGAAAFSPDGSALATGGAGQTVLLWSMATMQKAYELKGHTQKVRTLAFARNNRMLASGSGDGTVILWAPAAK